MTVRTSQTNGSVERFNRTVPEEFVRVALRETCYESVDALQKDRDQWLAIWDTNNLISAIGSAAGDRSRPARNTWKKVSHARYVSPFFIGLRILKSP